MKFRIRRASKPFSKERPCNMASLYEHENWYVELNTLEDLMKLQEQVDEDLIIENRIDKNILIYDTYIEPNFGK